MCVASRSADWLRRWTLEEAISFGCAAAPARLEYVEEPTRDVGAFFAATGMPVALDESVDEGAQMLLSTVDAGRGIL